MDLSSVYDAVLEGEVDAAVGKTKAALQAGAAPDSILNEALIPAMDKVGKLFEAGEYFLPEMLASGLAMKSCMSELAPELAKREDIQPVGNVVLGTVKGDVHDIGKNLVGVMLEGAGFHVIDLGIDVPREKFVDSVGNADILGLSGLVSTTIPEMGKVIKALAEAGVRDKVKVMVGGAPVTQEFADSIGADGFAKDAASAARKAKQLLGVE
jgi:corrinoid protein of di/trimethylamine methyltransferase